MRHGYTWKIKGSGYDIFTTHTNSAFCFNWPVGYEWLRLAIRLTKASKEPQLCVSVIVSPLPALIVCYHLTKCSYRSFVYKTNALTDHMILHRAVILTLLERGAFGTSVGTTSHFFVLFILFI